MAAAIVLSKGADLAAFSSLIPSGCGYRLLRTYEHDAGIRGDQCWHSGPTADNESLSLPLLRQRVAQVSLQQSAISYRLQRAPFAEHCSLHSAQSSWRSISLRVSYIGCSTDGQLQLQWVSRVIGADTAQPSLYLAQAVPGAMVLLKGVGLAAFPSKCRRLYVANTFGGRAEASTCSCDGYCV